jgi:hypothetical protein
MNVAFVMTDEFVVRLGERNRWGRAFVETIESLTFDSRVDEVTRLVHRGIVDAGHGLVGFLVSFTTAPLRVVTAC